jgi:site-specific DNA-methyltransferase (adenine-specific)
MRIDEATYKAMPTDLRALFTKLPNPGSAEVVGLFPEQKNGGRVPEAQRDIHIHNDIYRGGWKRSDNEAFAGDSGSAARFFYCAKASKDDRDDGCEGLEERVAGVGDVDESSGRDSTKPGNQYGEGSRRRVEAGLSPTMPRRNHHPTVKPTALMRYLCRLITPPGGVVLDPFMGSGSTGLGAWREGFRFIGIEREAEYFTLAIHRLRAAQRQPDLFHEAGKAEARELEETA